MDAIYATVPWRGDTKRLRSEYLSIDSPERVYRCLNCKKEKCNNCYRTRLGKIETVFVRLYNLGMCRQEIMSEMKIGRQTYYNYKKRFINEG